MDDNESYGKADNGHIDENKNFFHKRLFTNNLSTPAYILDGISIPKIPSEKQRWR